MKKFEEKEWKIKAKSAVKFHRTFKINDGVLVLVVIELILYQLVKLMCYSLQIADKFVDLQMVFYE